MSGTPTVESSESPSPRTPRPTRGVAAPTRIAVVRSALIAVAVLCLAASFGPIWLVRAGVLVALLAGGFGAWFLIGLLRAQRAASLHEVRELRRDHRAAFTAERTHNAEVVDELTQRVTAARTRVAEQDVKLGELGHTVSKLRGEKSSLAKALIARDATITGLTGSLADRTREAGRLESAVNDLQEQLAAEAALRADEAVRAEEALRAELARAEDDATAEVHGLPRRRTTDLDDEPIAATAS